MLADVHELKSGQPSVRSSVEGWWRARRYLNQAPLTMLPSGPQLTWVGGFRQAHRGDAAAR